MIPDHILEDIIPGDDGYYIFWPINGGAFTAHNLREIADELDRLNAPWDAEVKRYFDEHQ